MSRNIHILDLDFLNTPGTIASHLILSGESAVLVDCGPGSTQAALTSRLAEHGLQPGDITGVLLTHIHLDHAGAAGWLAQHGATIYVHPRGAPHLIDPEKLLASATRIYGDDMDRLWGEFLPVPRERLVELHDGASLHIGDLEFEVIETPGHASHHVAFLYNDLCFTGDVAGVRLQGTEHVSLPLPPPDIDLGLWRQSVTRLRGRHIEQLALTHFGLHGDVQRHLDAVERALDETEAWVERIMPTDPSDEELRRQVAAWLRELALRDGTPAALWDRFEIADPSWMAAAGLRRYWRKHKASREES